MFDEEEVRKDLNDYRENGPEKTTQWLIEQISEAGLEGLSVLDIGGGVGAIQHALLEGGAASAVHVDASSAYINAARDEAKRRELTERITFHQGNFIDIAPQLAAADIVTLDKVICCFDDMQALVAESSRLARKFYAVIFPIDNILLRMGMHIANFFMNIFTDNPFRMFVHPTSEVERLVNEAGLQRSYYRRSGIWQVIVYSR